MADDSEFDPPVRVFDRRSKGWIFIRSVGEAIEFLTAPIDRDAEARTHLDRALHKLYAATDSGAHHSLVEARDAFEQAIITYGVGWHPVQKQ